MIGSVRNSYVRKNSIHHTYNRAVAIHGVHYLRVQDNGRPPRIKLATWAAEANGPL